VKIANKTWVTSSLSGTAQACSTEMNTGVSWPNNQWASVTSPSGDTFEGGVVLRGSYANDGAASTIARYVFLYNASIGPGHGGIFIYSSYKFTEELTFLTGLTILQGDTFLFAVVGNILFVYQDNNLLETFTDRNNLYSFGSVVLEVHGGNGVANFAGGSVSVQNNIAGFASNYVGQYEAGTRHLHCPGHFQWANHQRCHLFCAAKRGDLFLADQRRTDWFGTLNA
jgi:hypothetical protein